MNRKSLSLVLVIVLAAGVTPGFTQTKPDAVSAAGPAATNDSGVVTLGKFEVTELKAFSDQAIPGKTPVAFSEVGQELLDSDLGARELPLILNSTPSVYATRDGGGAGDDRITVRGFDQTNISILINGVPANDLENGWLYWSNWDGLSDVTSTIQVERGLSNVTLPLPSVGGTINIITQPAASRQGGSFKLETGNDGFLKGTLVLNTGLLQNKFALTAALVKKQGDGYARGTWVEGYGYYLGATWLVNATNRLEVFVINAPQQHGQRSFASNIAAYDAGYARSLGYTEDQINNPATGALRQGPVNAGQAFNPNYAPVSPSYTGQQYYWGSLHARHDAAFLNEVVNYFSKPQINLNWYTTLSDRLKATAVVYYSGGRGGGSGTLYNTTGVYGVNTPLGAFAYIPNSDPLYGSAIEWNRTIAANAGSRTVAGAPKPAGQSLGILRNSVNNQDQFGAVAKAVYQTAAAWKFSTGLDWRTATIDHFQEIRDLLGGSYYIAAPGQYSQFDPLGATRHLGLGDKVGYDYTNTVDRLGVFVEGQYDQGPVTAFVVYGYSWVDYGFTDHFRRNAQGGENTLQPGTDTGRQLKGGVQYAFDNGLRVYANAGVIAKAPIFDGVIDDVTGSLVNTGDEKFNSAEGGVRYATPGRQVEVSAGGYYTEWRNRTVSIGDARSNTITYLRGIDADYAGVELEGAWLPLTWLRLDAAASVGDWTMRGDVGVAVNSVATGAALPSPGRLVVDGLKVGDAPQSQFTGAVTVFPARGLSMKLQGYRYERYWANYTPDSRANPNDHAQPWRLPDYSLFDLHMNYILPLSYRAFDVSVFLHVFNLFDATYVSDALDNSVHEAVLSAPAHSAQRAEVFLGPPTTYDLGMKIRF